jgi:hypothetical protein
MSFGSSTGQTTDNPQRSLSRSLSVNFGSTLDIAKKLISTTEKPAITTRSMQYGHVINCLYCNTLELKIQSGDYLKFSFLFNAFYVSFAHMLRLLRVFFHSVCVEGPS